MLKRIAIIALALALLCSTASAKMDRRDYLDTSWGVVVKMDPTTYYVTTLTFAFRKAFLVGYELDSMKNGCDWSVADDGSVEIEMEDGIHRARLIDGDLYYQFLPGTVSSAMSKILPMSGRHSFEDGSFPETSDFSNGSIVTELKSMSNLELIKLQHQISRMLFEKNLESGVRVPAGTYEIGSDIPAGSYRITIDKEETRGSIDIFENGEMVDIMLVGSAYSLFEIGKINLVENQTLKVEDTEIMLYPYTGLF